MNAVSNLGHQRFGETDDVVFVVIFQKRREGEATRVGGVIVGAVIVHGPVHELKIAIGAVSVRVEEIDKTHFPEAQFQAAHGEFAEERGGSAVGTNFFAAERNDLVPHEPGDIGSLAERRVADDVEVEEARNAKRFAESMPPGFLDVAQELRRLRDPQTSIESEHTRTSVLCFRREAVFSLVRRMKRGMPLGNKIGLAGNPQPVPFTMGKHDHSRIISGRSGGFSGGLRSLQGSIGLLCRDHAKWKKAEAGKEQLPRAMSWERKPHINYSEPIV